METLFPKCSPWLIERYGLTPKTIIYISYTRVSKSKFHFKGYRTNLKFVYLGTIDKLDEFCVKWFQKYVWKSKVNKNQNTVESLPSLPSGDVHVLTKKVGE